MRISTLLAGAMVSWVLFGCASTDSTQDSTEEAELLSTGVLTFEVNYTKDPAVTLPESGTFQVESRVQLDAREDLRPVLDEVVQRLGVVIEEELSAKGYRPDAQSQDFLVRYYLIAGEAERTDLNLDPEELLPAWIRDQAQDADVQGMAVLIDVLEPGEKRVVWRGACSGVIVRDAPQAEKEKRTRTAVRRLLESFPE